jgi:hypothetical protein
MSQPVQITEEVEEYIDSVRQFLGPAGMSTEKGGSPKDREPDRVRKGNDLDKKEPAGEEQGKGHSGS